MGSSGAARSVESSVYVAYTEPALAEKALPPSRQLRGEGMRSEVGTRGKSLGKQLEDASSRGFAWVVIIGKRELESGELTAEEHERRGPRRRSPSTASSPALSPALDLSSGS